MRWGDAEPGDLVEYKIPGGRKEFGIYLGIRTTNDDMGATRWLDILCSEVHSILLAVDLNDISVSVRSSLREAVG